MFFLFKEAIFKRNTSTGGTEIKQGQVFMKISFGEKNGSLETHKENKVPQKF